MESSSRHPPGSSDTKRRPSGGAHSYGGGLLALSIATVAVITIALALVFFYAPLEAEQGFLQKIFYLHVPLAIVALCGFVIGGVFGALHLRTRDSRWDMRSYVAIHMSLIFGVGTLITGSIWAKGSWGHWWVWSEPTLVSFLIVFLLYATYQPLRFAIEDPELQARYASVFAVTAGAFVPLNFIAVRLSTAYVHPRVLGSTSNLPPRMAFTFLVSLLGMALLFVTLCKFELTAKHTRAQLRALRRQADARAGAHNPAGWAGQEHRRRSRSAAPTQLPATRMSARTAGRPGT
jgi:heme exporter protein C